MDPNEFEYLVQVFFQSVVLQSFGESIKNFINENLAVNIWTLVVHLLSAAIIVSCIIAWVWKPTNDFINRNKQKLDKERNDLILDTRETRYFLKLLKKERDYVLNLKQNVERTAREEAAKILSDAQKEATEHTDNMKRDAEQRLKIIEEKAKEEIKSAIVRLSLDLTNKLIDANITEENNRKVIDAYLKTIEDKKIVSEHSVS